MWIGFATRETLAGEVHFLDGAGGATGSGDVGAPRWPRRSDWSPLKRLEHNYMIISLLPPFSLFFFQYPTCFAWLYV
ncbi:hypothetical protein LguiA_001238 [Lonicera macranthoides]